jgi:hypothetical protein
MFCYILFCYNFSVFLLQLYNMFATGSSMRHSARSLSMSQVRQKKFATIAQVFCYEYPARLVLFFSFVNEPFFAALKQKKKTGFFLPDSKKGHVPERGPGG